MWSLVLAAVSRPAVASPPELDVEGPPVAPGGAGLPFVPPVVRKLVDVPHGVVNGTNASAGEYEEVVVLGTHVLVPDLAPAIQRAARAARALVAVGAQAARIPGGDRPGPQDEEEAEQRAPHGTAPVAT